MFCNPFYLCSIKCISLNGFVYGYLCIINKPIFVLYGRRLSYYIFSFLSFIVIIVTKFNAYVGISPAGYFFKFQGLNFDPILPQHCELLLAALLRNHHYLYNIVITTTTCRGNVISIKLIVSTKF
jgi:hypothetical protein